MVNSIKYIEHDLGYKKINEAVLSNEGVGFNPLKKIPYSVEILENINTLWDEKKFEDVNLPKILFNLNQDEVKIYSEELPMRILDLPIKFPSSNYRLPKEIAHLKKLIQKIVSHEHLINEKVDDYYCYLTLDKKQVKKGVTTRKEGIHVDGFQGARLGDKLPVDHSYLLYDNNPTIFYAQDFKVGNEWDKGCHNYFSGFELQKKEKSQIQYPSNTILLIDAYCLHEAPVVLEDTFRTFLRLSFSVREFDRLGNAHNNMFDYCWEMHPRDIQKNLICPSGE